ncbi:hypothetical protein N7508_003068 [Penicillium antarcticum]|uniref:uncharacterized protein n=1 Tax=Penicillium antarcticum TaxID=416450 RepID=UPI00239F1867|nr:uncharacterized protein N7508_003068 [Penicillium antarcticum]KAJ5312238.1 hypothetical protein N7508_003068 [Penicillium antarcticum]
MASTTNSVLKRHAPPGNLSDLTEANKEKWSKDFISTWMQGEIDADPNVVGRGRTPLKQFFDGVKTPFNQGDTPKAVEWNAFPKVIRNSYQSDAVRWAIADSSRVVQDEYLEWSVSRGPRKYTGDIYSVTFTAEGPEYWQFLASCQKDDFLKLVKELNSGFASEMSDSEFFLRDYVTGNEVYNPANYWNLLSTTGAITHLIQPNNTLSAEVDIAAQATVIRKNDNGKIITDADELIKCSKYGNPGRNSDPSIGASINFLARGGASLSVAEPVALYIRAFEIGSFKFDMNGTTDGAATDLRDIENPEKVFQWQRGDIKNKAGLRIKIEVPEGLLDNNKKQLLVSNIYDTNKGLHIKYGAQFADYFTMGVSAVGIESKTAPPEACYKPSDLVAGSVKAPCAEFDGFVLPGFAGPPGSSRA